MCRVKEELLHAEEDAEWAAWEASPEGRAEKERMQQARAAAEQERARRERVWAVRNPDEWEEWVRLQPLLNPVIDFAADYPFDFDDFLMEVGRRPSASHIVVRRDDERAYQQENLTWACKQVEPPRSPYLNVEQAAAYLGVAVRTVYNNRQHIPALPGFRKLMFDPKVLDEVMASPRFKSKRRSSPR
ncbi:MAG: helix-turn-helix domain-containing protein [Gemmataceae bacterium]